MSTHYDWYLRTALAGRKGVLDLGCGAMRGALYLDPESLYVGVDIATPMSDPKQWPAHVLKREKGTVFVQQGIMEFLDGPGADIFSYDTVLLLDVIEHFTKADGKRLLTKIRARWPKARIIVYTPEGWLLQDFGEDHPQTHRSGWTPDDFEGWMVTYDPGNEESSFFAELRP